MSLPSQTNSQEQPRKSTRNGCEVGNDPLQSRCWDDLLAFQPSKVWAIELGYSEGTVSKWASGSQGMPLGVWHRILRILDRGGRGDLADAVLMLLNDGRAEGKPEALSDVLVDLVARVQSLVAESHDAFADGRVDRHERRRVLCDIAELRKAITDVELHVLRGAE